jgi:hypothetical protein
MRLSEQATDLEAKKNYLEMAENYLAVAEADHRLAVQLEQLAPTLKAH